MKKISTLVLTMLLALILLTSNAYAINENIVEDPGNTKWGLYHEETSLNNKDILAVNLRMHLGTQYFNQLFTTGLKFGTIKDYEAGVTNGTYTGYDHASATYAGIDNEGEYNFSINSTSIYNELVIDSRTINDTSWTNRYTGIVNQLEIFSWWDGLFFRVDNQMVYNSSMVQKNGYQESSELFRIYFKKSGEDTTTPVQDENIINIEDLNDLPATEGDLKDAKTSKIGGVKFTHYNNDDYDVKIFYKDKQYNLGIITLPGVLELGKEPIDGIYWSEGTDKYIYYEFQLSASDSHIHEDVVGFIDDINNIKGFRPYVQMNLSTKEYDFVNKLKLYAGYYSGPNGQAYADVLFPMELDELLAIEMEYRYRWITLYNWYGEWNNASIVRYKDEEVHVRSAWQHWSALLIPLGPGGTGMYNEIFSWFDSPTFGISKVTDLNQTYRENYLETINWAELDRGNERLTMDQLFTNDVSMYRVYLNTYNDGRFTGYEVHDDIAILNVTYKFEGIVYHVPYEDIKTIGGGGESEDTTDPIIKDNIQRTIETLSNIIGFFSDNWDTIVIIALVIIGVVALLVLLYFVSILVNGTKAVTSSMQKAFGPSQYSYKSNNKYRRSSSNGFIILILILAIALFFVGLGLGWF